MITAGLPSSPGAFLFFVSWAVEMISDSSGSSRSIFISLYVQMGRWLSSWLKCLVHLRSFCLHDICGKFSIQFNISRSTDELYSRFVCSMKVSEEYSTRSFMALQGIQTSLEQNNKLIMCGWKHHHERHETARPIKADRFRVLIVYRWPRWSWSREPSS